MTVKLPRGHQSRVPGHWYNRHRTMKILVVDDEAPIADAVAYNLRKEGHQPIIASDAAQALALFSDERPALVILDILLPSASGFDVCRRIRRSSSVPVIMLTARAEETDRVVGLELGADDYVTKPFSMRELMARVKSVLRRAGGGVPGMTDAPVQAGPFVVDPSRHEVTVAGRPVVLTRKEFDLLHFLVSNPGRAFSRTVLLDRVWGADAYIGERTVDVHMRWLREKVEEDPSKPAYLLTVRGIGYKLAAG